MKQKQKYIGIAVGFIAAEILLFFFVDRPVALYMHFYGDTSIVAFFRAITDLGKSIWYLVPCGLAVLFCAFLVRGKDVPLRYRRLFGYIGVRAFFLFATIGISGIVADIIKPIAGRARPILFLRENFFGFSPFTGGGFLWNGFPSGHTTTAFALACSLSVFYPRLRPVWFAYALLLAASRIIVDAHYPSDVVAGAMLGWLTTRLFHQYGMFRSVKKIFPIDSPLTIA